jgi:hypothetical protein
MRTAAAALVAGAALAAAPLASATLFQPIGPGGVHLVKVTRAKQAARSCAKHGNSQSTLGQLSRKVRPVACEQPPRAKVLDIGFAIVFKP